MAIATWNSNPYNGAAAGDINIRQWGKPISDALATVGWVKSADTGQIDWSTVVAGAGNVYAGYEIWKLADALQATAPVFLRLDYGSVNSASVPAMKVTVGTGSSGAGAISGIMQAEQIMCVQNTYTDTAKTSYASSDGSSLTLALFTGVSQYLLTLIIERSRDSNGAPTNKGLMVCVGSTYYGTSWTVYKYGSSAVRARWGAVGPFAFPADFNNLGVGASSSSALDATTAPAFPIVMYAPEVPAWVMQTAIVVMPGDAGSGAQPLATINGAQRTYKQVTGYGMGGPMNSSSYMPCIWWS